MGLFPLRASGQGLWVPALLLLFAACDGQQPSSQPPEIAIEIERAALITFKERFAGDGLVLSGWTEEMPSCQWSRVACNSNSRITKLLLNSTGLTGTLPEELSVLNHLEILFLHDNSLVGTLPREWSTLRSLKELWIFDNTLTGTLPKEWSALGSLMQLDIYNNLLTGPLPREWSALGSFQQLNIHSNSMMGPLPKEWSALESLERLFLHINTLTRPLPAEWSALGRLELLNIRDNSLDGPLPKEWSALRSLERIFLNKNLLTGSLPSEWSSLESLDLMNIQGNSLVGPLPTEWSALRSLERLWIYKNLLTGPLPREWSALGSLEGLWIYNNFLTGSLPGEWSNLKALRQLSVRENSLNGPLPIEWSALQSLERLVLYKNSLIGTLPGEWSALESLSQLLLHDNLLKGPLPWDWSAVGSLELLNIRGNLLTGRLPTNWSTLGSLQYMYLYSNFLTGPLPREWSALASIQYMWMYTNNLTGPLPAEWSVLQSLQRLILDNNFLTGPLIPEWSSLGNLTRMSIRDNLLTGTLPGEWSALRSLDRLVLHDNLLTGTLPGEWSALGSLVDLFLSDNAFTGPLPRGWRAFEKLQQLLLHNNSLTGPLPDEWSTLGSLKELWLHTNLLTGRLPHEWSLQTAMRDMILNANSLTGQLPPEWSCMSGLTRIQMIKNRLTGKLPDAWSILKSTELIQFSQNRMTGSLPLSWSLMCSMKIMDLAGNAFSGSLPESWSSMTNLAIMSLDSNRLSGTIPQPLIRTLLSVREHELAECEMVRNKCYADYKVNSTFAARLSIAANSISGTINIAEDLQSSAEQPIAVDNLAAGLNCLTNARQQQRFCPPKWLPLLLLGAVMVTIFMVTASKAANLRSFKLTSQDQQMRPPTLSIKSYAAEARRCMNEPCWLVAAFVAMGWSMFLVSPAFENHVILNLVEGGGAELIAVVMTRNLAATLQPLAWGLVFLWHGYLLADDMMSRSGASSWTIIATQDSLEENLSTIHTDQRNLMGLFVVLVPLVSALNWAALPAAFNRWVPVPTPLHDSESLFQEPPVWMEIEVEVPSKLVAVATALLLVVLYHALACVSLPAGFLTSSAIWNSCKPSVWPQAGSAAHRRALKSLFWLRQSIWAFLASALIAACGLSVAAVYIGETNTTDFDYFEDWRPYRDREAEGHYKPHTVKLGDAHVWIALAALAVQLLVTAGWLVSTMGMPFCGPQRAVESTVNGTLLEIIWLRMVSSRGNAQRNLCLLIIGLQMVPVLGAGSVGGWSLVGFTWGMSCALLAAAFLVSDRRATFDDLWASPGYGMVLDATDLAKALAVNLVNPDSADLAQRLSCCEESGSVAGCMACQHMLCRFPATQARMKETLAVSYRWQPVSQALLHPDCSGGLTDGVGMKDGVVGINMSRWQRRRLLQAIEETGLPYVWIDALSIPAGVLGPNPDPGHWLTGLSKNLLTRMMAVYAAAAQTVVLKSAEDPGARYHQRAWTMQEYCGARAIVVHSEEVQGKEVKAPSTFEEEAEFAKLRRNIRKRMQRALPLWVLRLAEGSSGVGTAWMAREAHLWGVEAYAEAQAKVQCQQPVDRVRALLPIFLNTPAQDAPELLELALRGSRLADEARLSVEVRAAMATAVDLVRDAVDEQGPDSLNADEEEDSHHQPPLLNVVSSA